MSIEYFDEFTDFIDEGNLKLFAEEESKKAGSSRPGLLTNQQIQIDYYLNLDDKNMQNIFTYPNI